MSYPHCAHAHLGRRRRAGAHSTAATAALTDVCIHSGRHVVLWNHVLVRYVRQRMGSPLGALVILFPILAPGGVTGCPRPIAPRDTTTAYPCAGSHRIHHHTDAVHSATNASAIARLAHLNVSSKFEMLRLRGMICSTAHSRRGIQTRMHPRQRSVWCWRKE